MSDPVVLLSTGDVVGPAGGVTDNSMVLFSGTSGKLIKGNNAVVTAAGLALLDDVDAAAQRTTLGLGTAATATLTTSTTDTTAGRVTKVGDFGLGTKAVLYDGDLNLLGNVTGFYRTVSGATNFPNGCDDSCFVHIGSGDTYSQTIVGYINNRMYTRGGVGVVPNISWQPWAEVWTSANTVELGTTATTAKTALSLENVNNTSDANKPVSTAQQTALNLKANLASPTFTGVPLAPTAGLNTNTTQLATTAFVLGQAASVVSPMDGVAAVGTSTRFARQDHVHASDTSRLSLAGGTMTGDLVINKGGGSLTLKGTAAGVENVAYMTFTDSTNARQGFTGVGSVSSRDVYLASDGGDVLLYPLLGSSILYEAGVPKLETTPTGVTVTGTVVATAFTGVASSATTLTGLTSTVAELNYVDGVTSNVQTQLDTKAPLASPALTGTPTVPTATAGTNTTQIASTAYTVAEIGSRAPTKTGGGASGSWPISVTGSSASCSGLAASATTLTGLTATVTELNYVDGVTSAIQTQLNTKAPLASPAFTGVPTAPTPSIGTRSTAIATMQNFANEFGSSLAANGHQKLPSGLIIQWGQITGNYNSTTFSFPLAFPTACLACGVMNVQGDVTGNAEYVQLWDFTATTVKAVTYTNISPGNAIGSIQFGWLAIGY